MVAGFSWVLETYENGTDWSSGWERDLSWNSGAAVDEYWNKNSKSFNSVWKDNDHLVILDKFELRNRRKPHQSFFVLLAVSEPRASGRGRRLAEPGLKVSRNLSHAEQIHELRVSVSLLPTWINKKKDSGGGGGGGSEAVSYSPVVLYRLPVSAQGVTGYSASLSVTLRPGLGPGLSGLKYMWSISITFNYSK